MWSFVIPAHDESALIGATLIALRDAVDALQLACEILVVDDASSDDTASIAQAHGARVIRVEHRQIAATRNAGAAATTGEVLVFIDADTQVDAALLRATRAALDAGAIGGGANLHMPEARGHQRWITQAVVWCLHRAGIAPGCYLFCTRTAFDAIGGFDKTLYASEDVRFSRMLGKYGRFVLLREKALTSGRKLHSHGVRAYGQLVWAFLRHGTAMLRDREHLGLWYDRRR